MDLAKHVTWEIVKGAETFESFQQKIISPIYLDKNLRHDVKEDIAVIEKLLLHSYFEYEFIDVALTQAVFTFEKALKWKYQEVNNTSSCDLGFEDLINWFASRNYFEVWDNEIIHQLRSIRNDKVHGIRKSLGGTAFLREVYRAIDLINDLQEDVELRMKRKKLMRLLQKQLHEFLEGGGVISWFGKREIVFRADIIFFNNKLDTPVYDLAIWKIFDLKSRNERGNIVPRSKLIQLTKCNLSKEIFQGKDKTTGELITISKIQDEQNKEKFDQWHKELYEQTDLPMILSFITIPQNNYFNSAVRKFHQS